MGRHLSLIFGVAALALSSGCIRFNHHSSELSFSERDLGAAAHLQRSGEISADVVILEVDNRHGSIRVTGTDTGPAEWSWNLTVRAQTEAIAEQAASEATCEPEWDGNRIRLIVSLPKTGGKQSFRSDLAIRVPRSTAVQVRNRFGTTEIRDLSAETDARSQHGAIEIRNVSGPVRAQTSFATLQVSGVGPAQLKNQHGKIEASNVQGELFAETSFGTLTAAGIEGDVRLVNQHGRIKGSQISGSVEAKTSFAPLEIEASGPMWVCRNQHGAVRLTVLAPDPAQIEATTSFGPLDLSLPSGIQPAIHARTTFGKIDSDYPVLMTQDREPFLEVGAGPPRVRLLNQHGRIRIVRM